MRIGRNVSIYLGTSVLSGILPLLLIPFLTKELVPADYGLMITIMALVSLVMPLVNWGLVPYVAVQYFRSDRSQFASLLSSIFIIPFITTFFLMMIFWFAAELIASALKVPSNWISIVPILSVVFFLPLVVQNLLRMQDNPFGYAAMEVAGAAINFGMTIALVFSFNLSWEGRILAAFAANISLSLVALIWLLRRKLFIFSFSNEHIGPAFRFGSGTVLHELATQSMRISDRLIIVIMVGQFAAGQYAVAVQVASVMLVTLAALNRAWTPFVFSALKKGTDMELRRLVQRSYIMHLGLLVFFIFFNLLLPVVYALLVDEKYHESIVYVFWLSLGYLFNGFYLTIVDHIFYLKKTHILAIVTTFNAISTIGFAYILINVLGPIGAPMAFAFTAFLTMLAVFFIVQRISPLPWLKALR